MLLKKEWRFLISWVSPDNFQSRNLSWKFLWLTQSALDKLSRVSWRLWTHWHRIWIIPPEVYKMRWTKWPESYWWDKLFILECVTNRININVFQLSQLKQNLFAAAFIRNLTTGWCTISVILLRQTNTEVWKSYLLIRMFLFVQYTIIQNITILRSYWTLVYLWKKDF